ncbi:uncharacterized protein K02A2.6-like [Ornithodoros turicata]|uniref:uncharacterized protein K02A2.6-like n=1 Tax=Ornithodoros turicata TaxID=34597 RepID=UPI003138804C
MTSQGLTEAACASTTGPLAPPFNPFAVEPPGKSDFKRPEGWRRWATRWERYRVISGLQKQDASTQINTFLYAMGSGAEDVLISLRLTEEAANDYVQLKAAFDKYFVPSKNVIYERARFNLRSQMEHETVEEFVKELHSLAEFCDFGPLKDELIRDRIVVGLRDRALSERLQLDASLTLEKAVSMARNSETVKGQQSLIRGNGPTSETVVEALTSAKSGATKGSRSRTEPRTGYPEVQSAPCKWCGSRQFHQRTDCPAQGKTCNLCKKLGHFASVCKSASPSHKSGTRRRQQGKARRAVEEVFLGDIRNPSSSDAWYIIAKVDGKPVNFKVDTGADVTAVPPTALSSQARNSLTQPLKSLYGPGRAKINTLGQVEAQVDWNGKTTTQEIFVVQGLQHALLGRPAIKALDVLPQLLSVNHDVGLNAVPSEFQCLFGSLGRMKATYSIRLKQDARPHAVTYPRRVALPLLPGVQAELHRMEELGVIKKVEHATEWCAPMVVVRKKNGSLRICVDYGELNAQVVRERIFMPTVEENLNKVTQAKVFSKLDCNAGYWQAPLSPESCELTTFITPLGRYQFLRLPFGIATAPEFFQREMLRILQGLEGTVCHMDDVLIFGRNEDEHDKRLHAVLRTLKDAGVTLNEEKCQFRRSRIHFLGHILGANGISADPDKTEAIRKMPAPQSVSELRSFFGMLNHLAKFLPHMAEKTKALRDLLASDAAWYWGPQQQEAFEKIKEELASTPVLTYYSPLRPHTLSVDASSYGLGAVLLQDESNGERHPVAYASRALTTTEQRYAQVEKEALAVTWACEKFRMYVLGLPFQVQTDHKPLVPILTSKRLDDLTPRLQRLRMRTLEYDFSVTYVSGKELYTADVLSRNPVPDVNGNNDMLESAVKDFEVLTVDLLPASRNMLSRIRNALRVDQTLCRVMEYCETQWPPANTLPADLRRYASLSGELSVVRGLLLRGSRLVVPPVLRNEILERLHTGHQGITRCRARARESAWWPGISLELQDYIRRCPTCQEHRIPGVEPLMQSTLPQRPWETIGMDLFYANGRSYLVVVDYFSKFFELSRLKTTTSANVIAKIRPMFARFGVPDVVRSDNGPQFASGEFQRFLSTQGIKHVTSSPHFPQSNGQAERTVQTAKALLKKELDVNSALLAHRTTPGSCGHAPAELLMGRRLQSNVPVNPKSLIPSWPYLHTYRRRYRKQQVARATVYDSRHRVAERPELRSGTTVCILAGAGAHGTILGMNGGTNGGWPHKANHETPTGVVFNRSRTETADNSRQTSNSANTTGPRRGQDTGWPSG